MIAVIPVDNGAVATSGAAHIIDARTGRPPSRVTSVTVLAPSLHLR